MENPRLIDQILPLFDIGAAYRIHVAAPASLAYDAVSDADFGSSFIIRLLLSLRRGRIVKSFGGGPWRKRLEESSFIELAETPGKELVLGIAGKFWRPDGGACSRLTSTEFQEFCRPGFVRAAWNFQVIEQSANSSQVTTETRIQCFGPRARWMFRSYWSLVGPFSAMIRRAMLSQIKTEAERRFLSGAARAMAAK